MVQSFDQFLATASVNIPIFGFILNLILASILSILLAKVYVKFGNSLSNRKEFAKNFLLITMTTMLIITIVKSSLALSLGLVGALSIIRFRAAIKEPEELAYLFLAISIGLGLGANQTTITLIAFTIIVLIIILHKVISSKNNDNQNLILIINSQKQNGKIKVEDITNILGKYCAEVELRRFDENDKHMEISFLVNLNKFEDLLKIKKAVFSIDSSAQLTFIDNNGIL